MMPPQELIDAAIELLIYATGAVVILAGLVWVFCSAVMIIIKAIRHLVR